MAFRPYRSNIWFIAHDATDETVSAYKQEDFINFLADHEYDYMAISPTMVLWVPVCYVKDIGSHDFLMNEFLKKAGFQKYDTHIYGDVFIESSLAILPPSVKKLQSILTRDRKRRKLVYSLPKH